MTLLLVLLGAAFGAPARYLTDRFVQSRHDSVFPWGTFCVNVAGSFLLGALAAGPADPHLMALLGVGFCGGLTTYSTFGYETVRLIEDGAYLYALANVTASVAAGLGAAVCGAALAVALT
ncbi:MAG TPA: fluoride efflux transporter CrcB [Micromonosporaceae bacterium]|jgi:CrcB protein